MQFRSVNQNENETKRSLSCS
eukprot:COSAG03_NODE_7737_length_878_cov_1.249037_2_plen_20_part_01